MRPRIRLSEEQLQRVDELRAMHFSWSAIGRELGVHRQVVQREYVDWERLRGIRDLQSVRREAAALQFNRHLTDLEVLGDELAHDLEVLLEPRKDFVERPLFDRVLSQDQPIQPADDQDEHMMVVGRGRSGRPLEGRLRLRRRWVFDGLEMHFRGTDWSSLVEQLDKVRHSAGRDLVNLGRNAAAASDEPPGYRDAGIGPLADQLLDIVWDALVGLAAHTGVLSAKSGAEWRKTTETVWAFTRGVSLVDWTSEQVRINPGPGLRIETAGEVVVPPFASQDEAQGVVDRSRHRLTALLLSDEAQRLHARLQEAADIIGRMTALLDEVRLRPLVLRTRCDLCVV